MRKRVRKRVILKLPLGDVEIRGVGIGVTLVRVELMERLLLIVLGPATVRGVHTSIYASRVSTNRRETTTLFEGGLADIHTTGVTHAVRLTTTILGAEAVLHELLVVLGSYLNSGTVRVRTVMAVNTRRWVIGVRVLLIVAIRLEPGGVLRHGIRRYESLRTVKS